MTHSDFRGLAVSGASREALECFEQALTEFQCYIGNPFAAIDRVDPCVPAPGISSAAVTARSTWAIVSPWAHSSTIRARNAKACEVLRRRTHPVSIDRSWSDNTTGSSFGLGTPITYPTDKELLTQDTSRQFAEEFSL